MLGTVLRSRALVRPTVRVLTRFSPATSVTVRALQTSTPRTFNNTSVSQENGYGERPTYPGGDTSYSDAYQKPRPRNSPSETLYVGNLPFTAVKEQIEEFFSEFGPIISVRLGTYPSGEAKGFAHVQFADIDAAKKAMEAHEVSQLFLDSRTLNLDFAGPMTKAASPPGPKLYFGNYDGDEALLEETLEEFKDVITQIKLMRNPQTNASNRFGFIECATTVDATNVLNKFGDKEIAYGQKLELAYARQKSDVPRFTSYGRGEDRGRGYNGGGGGGRGGRGGYSARGYGEDEGEYRPRREYGGDRGGSYGGDRGGSYGGDRGGSYGGDRGGSYGGDRGGSYGGDRGGSFRGRGEGSFRGRGNGSFRGRPDSGGRGGGEDDY